ncbi:MAG: OsmC family protein [bacterium]
MSEEKEIHSLEGELGDYKSKVATATKGILTWDKDLIFTGRTMRGYTIEFDAKVEWGCMPTESLLLSLAGCMGIDCVSFLQKMKCDLKSFRIDIAGERNPTPPQYYTAVEMAITVVGTGITDKKMQRAISLSQDKYCSVYNSLRKDMKVAVKYSIKKD